MADLRNMTELQKAQYNAQKSIAEAKSRQQAKATQSFGKGLLDVGMTVNSFMPVTGDIQSGLLAANDLKNKDYTSAALNSLGLLPFVPSMASIVKNKSLDDLARAHFGVTGKPQETGFILDDGSRLDFSGRHEASGYVKSGDKYIPQSGQPDYLRGERSTDHRTVTQVIPNSQYGWDALSNFIDQTGAVRYMPETGVSMVHTNKPSEAQLAKIVNDFRMSGNPLIMDIDHAKHGSNLATKEFEKPTLKAVSDWINKEYSLLGSK